MAMTWQPRAHNTKTGPIITGYCGQSWDEIRDTCHGCALRDTTCYAYRGTPKLGFGSMARAATDNRTAFDMSGTDAVRPGGRYSLDYAIRNRNPRARSARLGAWGDPARVPRRELFHAVGRLRRAGLAVLGYTHFWREHRPLRTELMASCDTVAEADQAVDTGWIPAAIVPSDTTDAVVKTPAGRRLVVCPAQRSGVTCDDCRLCDPRNDYWRRQRTVRGVAFREH